MKGAGSTNLYAMAGAAGTVAGVGVFRTKQCDQLQQSEAGRDDYEQTHQQDQWQAATATTECRVQMAARPRSRHRRLQIQVL